MLSKLAVRRLTKLANYMDKLPEEQAKRFDMFNWFGHYGEHEVKSKSRAFIKRDCGTKACAAGWACTMPEFKRAGLKIDRDDQPTYKKHHSWSAVQKFFDLHEVHAESIFNASSIYTPKQWAKHCRKFIRDNTA